MDPNDALRIIRATIKQVRIEAPTSVRPARPEFIQHALDLAEAVAGLDEWLSADGVLPAEWLAEEEKPKCVVEHGDWTGPHVRISSCPPDDGRCEHGYFRTGVGACPMPLEEHDR